MIWIYSNLVFLKARIILSVKVILRNTFEFGSERVTEKSEKKYVLPCARQILSNTKIHQNSIFIP